MEDSGYTYGVGARNCDEQEQTSNLAVLATESKPTEWTDEKHSLYLKSMEATFVNQLYKSLNLLSGSKSSKHKQTTTSGPSSQFKVLRDGCWSKIDITGDREEVNQDNKHDVLFSNQWIQHYRSSDRQPIRKVRAQDISATNVNKKSTRNFHLWNRDSCNKEMTDQNFNDEDIEEEKCDGIHETKRTRTSTDRVSSNDQVVPFEKNVQVDAAAEDDIQP